MTANTLRVDLHSHTWYSGDSSTAVDVLVDRAREVGLAKIAVTDHGSIDGAVKAHALAPDLVIIGEEVRCACGTELIGLFLEDWIPNGLTIEAAADRIRSQGGLVYAPHPYAYLRGGAPRSLRAIAAADIIEVFNSRAFYPPWNRRALAEATRRGMAMAASTDAHFPWEFGRAYTAIAPFTDPASFLVSMRAGEPTARAQANPLIHAASLGLHGVRHVLGRGHGVPLKRARSVQIPADAL